MKLTKRTWFSIVSLGLVGQFAWTLENMYFNVFLYNTISTQPRYIANMVAASAVCATLTTLLIGTLSDRLGKRKVFISFGYIVWGIITLLFGFISVENTEKLFHLSNGVALSAVIVVVADCVMTFFGSAANDAAFNAYITDITDKTNRGKVESVLATLPLISMLIIFGFFDPLTAKGEWTKFFAIFGVAVTLTGVFSLWFLEKPVIEKKNEAYFKSLVYGFKPTVIKQNRLLYFSLAALCVFGISVQVFFPYLIIYIQSYLKIEAYALVLGVVLLAASAVSVLSGKYIDKFGKMKFIIPALAVMLAGLVGMFFARGLIFVMLAGSVMMGGYMLVTSVLSANVRDYTPKGKVGLFQGIRMIFAVLIPMVTGPYIGSFVIGTSAETYVELGVVKSVPTPYIFLAAAAVLVLISIPLSALFRAQKTAEKL